MNSKVWSLIHRVTFTATLAVFLSACGGGGSPSGNGGGGQAIPSSNAGGDQPSSGGGSGNGSGDMNGDNGQGGDGSGGGDNGSGNPDGMGGDDTTDNRALKVEITNLESSQFTNGTAAQPINIRIEGLPTSLKFTVDGVVAAEETIDLSTGQKSGFRSSKIDVDTIGDFTLLEVTDEALLYQFDWNSNSFNEDTYSVSVEVSNADDEDSAEAYEIVVDRSLPQRLLPTDLDALGNVNQWVCGVLEITANEGVIIDDSLGDAFQLTDALGVAVDMAVTASDDGRQFMIALDDIDNVPDQLNVIYDGSLVDLADNELNAFGLQFDMTRQPQNNCDANGEPQPAADSGRVVARISESSVTPHWPMLSMAFGLGNGNGMPSPVIAWHENRNSFGDEIYAKQFDGTEWVLMGNAFGVPSGDLNDGFDDPQGFGVTEQPGTSRRGHLISDDGPDNVHFLAWEQHTGGGTTGPSYVGLSAFFGDTWGLIADPDDLEPMGGEDSRSANVKLVSPGLGLQSIPILVWEELDLERLYTGQSVGEEGEVQTWQVSQVPDIAPVFADGERTWDVLDFSVDVDVIGVIAMGGMAVGEPGDLNVMTELQPIQPSSPVYNLAAITVPLSELGSDDSERYDIYLAWVEQFRPDPDVVAFEYTLHLQRLLGFSPSQGNADGGNWEIVSTDIDFSTREIFEVGLSAVEIIPPQQTTSVTELQLNWQNFDGERTVLRIATLDQAGALSAPQLVVANNSGGNFLRSGISVALTGGFGSYVTAWLEDVPNCDNSDLSCPGVNVYAECTGFDCPSPSGENPPVNAPVDQSGGDPCSNPGTDGGDPGAVDGDPSLDPGTSPDGPGPGTCEPDDGGVPPVTVVDPPAVPDNTARIQQFYPEAVRSSNADFAVWIEHAANGQELRGFTRTDGDWSQIGTALNVDASGSPGKPAVALSIDANQPVAAFTEYNFETNQGGVYVRQFDGSEWQLVGDSQLNVAGYEFISDPVIAVDVMGRIVVAWSEYVDRIEQANIYVARWDGQEWALLSSVLDDELQNDGSAVSLTINALNNEPIIAYGELQNDGIFAAAPVLQWTGVAWAPLGEGLPAESTPTAIRLRFLQNRLLAAWDELDADDGFRTTVNVAEFSITEAAVTSGNISAGSWFELGANTNLGANSAYTADVYLQGSTPLVAQHEARGVFVRYWDGSNWRTGFQSENYATYPRFFDEQAGGRLVYTQLNGGFCEVEMAPAINVPDTLGQATGN